MTDIDSSPTLDSLTPTQKPAGRRRKVAKVTLIALTILWALLLVPALLFALMSPFAFDSGATEEAYRVFYLLISFPFVLFFSTILAWILYWFKRYILSVATASIPALFFLYAVFLMK